MTPAKVIQVRPTLNQSNEFQAQVGEWRDDAQSTINRLARENERARAEIIDREAQITEQEDVVRRCNAALNPPKLPTVQ